MQPILPSGLVGIDLPAGEHRLEVRFEETPLRRACTVASLLSAALLAAVACGSLRHRASRAVGTSGAAPALGSWAWALLVATTAGYLILKTAAIDRHGLGFWTRRFDGTAVSGARVAASANFGGELQLLGADL